jgi:hypothetical protein
MWSLWVKMTDLKPGDWVQETGIGYEVRPPLFYGQIMDIFDTGLCKIAAGDNPDAIIYMNRLDLVKTSPPNKH